MKRKLKKLLKITFISLLSAFLTIVAILLFPRPLFAHKLHYKEFTVCSNSKIDREITTVLENARTIVQGSELYDAGYHYNIILAHHTFYNKIDDWTMRHGPAARSRLKNVIVKVKIDPKTNLAFPTFPKACQTNLTELIAHEMLHCLQAHKYGIKKFNPFNHPPFWKLEGYPEYISKKARLSGVQYNLAAEVERYEALKSKANGTWIADEAGGCEAPDHYLRGRLMTDYLINIRHYSYDQILKDTVSETTLYKQMIQWKDSVAKRSPVPKMYP